MHTLHSFPLPLTLSPLLPPLHPDQIPQPHTHHPDAQNRPHIKPMMEDHNIRQERHHHQYIVEGHDFRRSEEEYRSGDEDLCGVGEYHENEHPGEEVGGQEVGGDGLGFGEHD